MRSLHHPKLLFVFPPVERLVVIAKQKKIFWKVLLILIASVSLLKCVHVNKKVHRSYPGLLLVTTLTASRAIRRVQRLKKNGDFPKLSPFPQLVLVCFRGLAWKLTLSSDIN